MSSKIGKKEWIVLYVVMGGIDFVQFVIIECVLVWVFGVGAAINEILDPIIGALFAGYLVMRGVSIFSHFKRFASILGMEALEEFTGGIAQLWILDAWYIHNDVKKEDAAIQAEIDLQAIMQQSRDMPLNNDGARQPGSGRTPRQAPLNAGGYGAPRGELPKPNGDNRRGLDSAFMLK